MTDLKPAGTSLAERINARGIETVFSLAGAGHTHLLLPLEDLGVRIVGTRHETGAVGAADGYARTTGGLGIAAIIAEQGLPNAIAPLSTAYHHGTPLVVLVTRFPDSWVEAAGEYVVDHHALVSPVCKWVRTVPSADKIPDYFDAACRIARAGRPGPTVLVIPQDFLAAPIPVQPAIPQCLPAAPAVPDPDVIAQAADVLAQANHPAIVVDTGLLDGAPDGAGAAAALTTLSADLGCPVFTYGSARGLVPEDQAGVLPWPYAQTCLLEADLLIVAGARLNMWYGFGRPPRFPDALKVIQFDTDAAQIGRNNAVTLGAAGDPAAALSALVSTVQQRGMPPKSLEWLNAALASRKTAVSALAQRGAPKIHALELLTALENARPKAGVFVGDGADILNWSQATVRIERRRGYMDHHPLGSMGVCLPLALGAAAAERDLASRENRMPHKTTLLTGDGAFGFYMAELDTMVREDLPITIVVANDGQWGTEIHGQRLMTGRDVNTAIGVGDYAKIASGFGLRSTTVDALVDLQPALKDAFTQSGPTLVDVRIDPDAGAALKTTPDLSFLIFSDLAPPEA